MTVTYVKGTFQEFTSKILFNLNFEDKTPSASVRPGETLKFDGETAVYMDRTEKEHRGRAPSLKGAVTAGWIISGGPGVYRGMSLEKPEKVPELKNPSAEKIPMTKDTYDDFKGGDFDAHMNKTQKPQVIHERDMIVKETHKTPAVGGSNPAQKREVDRDQVMVRESTRVGNSTSAIPGVKKHSTEIRVAEQYGADSSVERREVRKVVPAEKKAFTVDSSTPRIQDGASKEEIDRITRPVIVQDSESQEARVVGKIGAIKKEIIETEGVTLTNTTENVSSRPIDTSAKVTGSKNTPVSVINEDTAQVIKRASQRPKVEPVSASDQDYISRLPADWSSIHWTKKEKFIQTLTDRAFIEYILKVETLMAVKNACKDRLRALAKEAGSQKNPG